MKKKLDKIDWRATGLLEGIPFKPQISFVTKVLDGIAEKIDPFFPTEKDDIFKIHMVVFPIARRVANEIFDRNKEKARLLTSHFIINEVYSVYPGLYGVLYNFYKNTNLQTDIEAETAAIASSMIVEKFFHLKSDLRLQKSKKQSSAKTL